MMQVLAETFRRAAHFDLQAYLREHLGKVSSRWEHPAIDPRPLGLEGADCALAGALLPDYCDCD